MSLVTTKRQQYGLVQGILADTYEQILAAAPALGVQILVAVLNSYGYQPQTGSAEPVVATFIYRSKETKVSIPDEPFFYANEDDMEATSDNQITMLKVFDGFLCKQGDDDQGIQLRQIMLDELAGQVLPTLLVRRLLKSAAHYPAILGMELRELAWALPLLIHYGTRNANGEFISAIFPKLARQERERLEEAILSIPKLLPPQDQEHSKSIQDQLILHLTPTNLVSEAARAALIAALQNQTEISQKALAMTGSFNGMFDLHANQAEKQAIPVNDPHYQAIYAHQQTIEGMEQNLTNASPSDDQAQVLLRTIDDLQNILNSQTETAAHPIIVANAWDAIAEASWLMVYWPSLLEHPDIVQGAHDLLLLAAKRPEPAGDAQSVDDMMQTIFWSRPAARIYAAQGLLKLATLPGWTDENVMDALKALASDSAPSVRIRIAERIHLLDVLFPEFMWEVLEQRVATEAHPQILHLLLQYPLNNLQHKHGERVITMVQAIDARTRNFKRAEIGVNWVMPIYLHQYLFSQSAACRDLLLQIADHPSEHIISGWPLASHLRESIKCGRRANVSYQKQTDLLNRLISSTYHDCKKHIAALEQRPQATWTEADQQMAQELLKLANHLGEELFFLSGAFPARSVVPPNPSDDPPPSPEQVQDFWRNHHHSIDLLAALGLPVLTHHILEILDYLFPIAPPEVFLLFRDALRAAAHSGYQHEKMGVDLALKIVNSFLAEHRAIFYQDRQCGSALLDVLDILLQSGWSDARKLAYQIYKVYR